MVCKNAIEDLPVLCIRSLEALCLGQPKFYFVVTNKSRLLNGQKSATRGIDIVKNHLHPFSIGPLDFTNYTNIVAANEVVPAFSYSAIYLSLLNTIVETIRAIDIVIIASLHGAHAADLYIIVLR